VHGTVHERAGHKQRNAQHPRAGHNQPDSDHFGWVLMTHLLALGPRQFVDAHITHSFTDFVDFLSVVNDDWRAGSEQLSIGAGVSEDARRKRNAIS
jgi:hypothetical protein